VICVGLDDTDVAGSPGTNQLARALVAELTEACRCERIVRHQLLVDPRVPCTTKNGSASILLQPLRRFTIEEIVLRARRRMQAWYVEGSDPGLCVAAGASDAVIAFGRRCQRELLTQSEARAVAAAEGFYLEGLAGTQDGVIGALAAVGLAASDDDGRIVQWASWPDDLAGLQPLEALTVRDLEIRELATNGLVEAGWIDVGKHLRPNRRQSRNVLFVEPSGTHCGETRFRALKLP